MKRARLAFLCLSLAVAVDARHRGGFVADLRSDSGRSLVADSDKDARRNPDGEGEGLGEGPPMRGTAGGLAPVEVQVHLAVQEMRRRLDAPLLLCRSRFVDALLRAGPEAEHIASLAVETARQIADLAADGALQRDVAHLDWEPDHEIGQIQTSLAAGQRYPAGDILEARWKRVVRMSRMTPDDAILEAVADFRESARPLWRAVEQVLRAQVRLPDGAKATLLKFRKCLQHRLPHAADDHRPSGRGRE